MSARAADEEMELEREWMRAALDEAWGDCWRVWFWICTSSRAMWLRERRRLRTMPASRLLARCEEGVEGNSSRPSCPASKEPLGGEVRMMVDEAEDVGEGIFLFFFFFLFFSFSLDCSILCKYG